MKYASIISGLAGSLALTLLHETLRKNVDLAPRMDLMGEQGLAKVLFAAGIPVPDEPQLFNLTMGGDLVGNAGYYALVSTTPKHPLVAGAVLGLVAGAGALALPDKIGLNEEYSNASRKTQILTMAIYFMGGIVAGIVYKAFEKNDVKKDELKDAYVSAK
jgi:hypothetical protein